MRLAIKRAWFDEEYKQAMIEFQSDDGTCTHSVIGRVGEKDSCSEYTEESLRSAVAMLNERIANVGRSASKSS